VSYDDQAPSIGAVVPVAASVRDDLTVISIERYEGGLAVRWLHAADGRWDDALGGIAVSDDLGTTYELVGSGGFGPADAYFGGAGCIRGESLFRPAVPSEATTLRVAYLGDHLDVAL